MTLYLTLCRQSQGSFQSVLGSINGLFESGLFLSHLYEFLDLTPRVQTLPGARPVPRPIEQGIEFAKASPSPDTSDLEQFVYTETD